MSATWRRPSARPRLAAASPPAASSPSEHLTGVYPESSVSALSDSPPAEPLTEPGRIMMMMQYSAIQ